MTLSTDERAVIQHIATDATNDVREEELLRLAERDRKLRWLLKIAAWFNKISGDKRWEPTA